MPRRIIGIDPGSAATGWGIVDAVGTRSSAVAWGVIRAKGDSRAQKLADLSRGIAAVLAEHRPSEAAVETPFTGRNPKSTIALAEARGVILACVGNAGIRVVGYSPASVKMATVGHGRADKQQIGYMVVRLLSLEQPPAADAADALAIALTHLQHSRITSVVSSVPPKRR